MAIVVGSFGVGSAWVLLRLIALVTNIAYHGRWSTGTGLISLDTLGYWSILIPVAGSAIVGIMARYGSDKIRGHGIPEALEAILIGQSRIDAKVAVLKPLSSAIAIGTGGPFGAEGPIIMTGGALGSLFAQCFDMSAAERKTLLVAGAAAGMTAVFGTPIAAALLAIELLLFEWKPRSFIPVLVACMTAIVERSWVFGPGALFPHTGSMPLDSGTLLLCCALGIVCGFASGLLTAMVYAAEDAFKRLPVHWMWWPMIGGLVVGVGGVFDPDALGVGYANIAVLLHGGTGFGPVLRLMLVKAIIWAIALGSGTSGGVLAPLLIIGGCVGGLFGHLLPHAGPGDWALDRHGGNHGRHHARTAHRHDVRRGTDRRCRPDRAAAGCLRRQLCVHRAAAETLDPDREGGAPRLSHHPRIQRRSARSGSRAGCHGGSRRYRAGKHDGRRTGGIFQFQRAASSGLSRVDQENRPVALASRADALSFVSDTSHHGLTLMEALGKRDMVIGFPDEPVSHLVGRMVQADSGRVPVVQPDDGGMIGLVARQDLLRVRARMLGEERTRQRVLSFALAWARNRRVEAGNTQSTR